ncbi:hypothetical protein CRD60_04795 [Bifidobacterium aemilianum]|uniref:ABC transporter domain-containing protein n=1 Tax=Bifidobacterium aemilianum TaxID=2493120 RepID=A0A366K9I3_9BIFI|nr:ATP-binding cassette domain-containing protein [Bifidobacterium aemilianum]RBP97902.1 hypothetical protein CRD60_04795 [Bifidobacterium aemilianum]
MSRKNSQHQQHRQEGEHMDRKDEAQVQTRAQALAGEEPAKQPSEQADQQGKTEPEGQKHDGDKLAGTEVSEQDGTAADAFADVPIEVNIVFEDDDSGDTALEAAAAADADRAAIASDNENLESAEAGNPTQAAADTGPESWRSAHDSSSSVAGEHMKEPAGRQPDEAGPSAASPALAAGKAGDQGKLGTDRDQSPVTLARHIDTSLASGNEDEVLLKSHPAFCLDHVTVHDRKSGRDVLVDLSWEGYPGRTYAITGFDDEQRKALMAVMGGFLRPSSGQVLVRSSNLADLLPSQIRGHRIGLVPQEYALRPDLDATGNLVYAMDASGRTFLKPMPELARDLLAKVGFTAVSSGVPVRELTVMERRLVAVARAISCEAEVLVIDQPTAGLDSEESGRILDLLARLSHQGASKRCIIMLTPPQADSDGQDRSASREAITAAADETLEL